MRKWLYLLLGIVLFANTGFADNKVYTTDVNALPQNSRQFLATHFSEIKVAHISIEKEWYGIKDYDVILTDGTEVEFRKNGEWKEVSRRKMGIPSTILLAPIRDYVKTNFSTNYIVSVEADKRKYEVKLDNGIELDFDRNGNLREVDF